MPATAVLMPITRPRRSARAPPELPGLSAASVWMTFSTTRTIDAGPRRQRPVEAADDAGGDRAGQPHRAADGDHELADPKVLGIAELGGGEPVAAHPDEAEVGEAVGPGYVEGQLTTVAEGRDRRTVALPRTWAEVSTKPSGVITTPEPAPPASGPGRRVP